MTPKSFRHKSSCRMRWQKQSHVPAARQQNAVLTRIQTRFATAKMQRTNHYTTTWNHWLTARIWPMEGLADAGRELKSCYGRVKKPQSLLLGIKATAKSARFKPGRETPREFLSIALTTLPRLREFQLPNEAKAGCYISSCGGGFFDADPGTHSTASFLGLSHLSHSVHFLGMK